MYHVAILEESQGTFWWAGKEYNRHDGRGHYWLKAVANKETGIIRGTKVISTVKWEDWEKRRKAAKTLIKSLTTTQSPLHSPRQRSNGLKIWLTNLPIINGCHF